MSVPTVSLNEATPAGSHKVREGDDRIREYKTQNREILDVDHVYPTSGQDADAGKHNKVSFVEAADIGTGAEGKPILGAQTVSGEAALVFTTEGDADVQVMPAGIVHTFVGAIASIPTGFLFCNGAAISRTTYARLYAAISTIHGVGDGSTTFNIPDFRDISVIGAKEDDSGTPKTNVSGALTASGGAATHTLTTAQMPAHTHGSVVTHAVSETLSGGADWVVNSSGSTASTGGGGAHNNLHPYKVGVFIIKT